MMIDIIKLRFEFFLGTKTIQNKVKYRLIIIISQLPEKPYRVKKKNDGQPSQFLNSSRTLRMPMGNF